MWYEKKDVDCGRGCWLLIEDYKIFSSNMEAFYLFLYFMPNKKRKFSTWYNTSKAIYLFFKSKQIYIFFNYIVSNNKNPLYNIFYFQQNFNAISCFIFCLFIKKLCQHKNLMFFFYFFLLLVCYKINHISGNLNFYL